MVSSSIIQYHPISSSIIQYHPVSSSIIQYFELLYIIHQKYVIISNFLSVILQFHQWKMSNHTPVRNETEALPNLMKPKQNAQIASLYMWQKGLGGDLLISVTGRWSEKF